MEYVIVDARQRLIGTHRQVEPLTVGATFSTEKDTYAVLNVDWARRGRSDMQTLTVVKIQSRTSEAI
ncbi:hypothetical protein [Gloeobacter kilaueensis]|uniref:Uncharacterized protein n=1 Tax=Gloeobacter kilaueensis (strain ATCC BAA-2537 / CCAP 1431/1 / ULC 316 / JS1) TaxID=1183438 RepID=U5QS96_GLOK1|nr:hypothetical protein [Gloeobacter kilaueensis]AGY60509.1 hypothetical protein GKIL_4263 [Gloeobacter kilaueensis JS1]